MSSLTIRKTIKTYSRQRKHSLDDEEPPAKRRRVNATPEEKDTAELQSTTLPTADDGSYALRDSSAPVTSSPKNPIFSSDVPTHSSPPSSPLREQQSPLPQRRRPVFSIFKRNSEPSNVFKEPLSERSDNIQAPAQPPIKKKRLVQMQLDLVSEVRKTCKTCGMEYIPSNSEDATIHRKFHSMNVGGVGFTKGFVERLRKNQAWVGGDGSFIAVIGRKDTTAFRNKATEILRVVNTELAAVSIPDEDLWNQVLDPLLTNAQPKRDNGESAVAGKGVGSASDRFKVYLYIRGQKCIGMCLAERVHEAYSVLDQDDASDCPGQGQDAVESQSSSISVSTETDAVLLGVSRIWTSSLHRKHGIATRLLDSARSNFLYGMTIGKEQVAFSQPTESGGRLARKWFGRRAGWHVYMD
ncbi:ESCO1/2 acetyl-transferase-domain-containing protein [Clohesyomyces aquaticus]|uniref:ESCO1/2 acetyl-transferase-domain-containing protein n=1 Tax=Clohesyomyces aquaticus TaxID=1231657 RepID=A0A1Y2A1E8_9PLEO|nr:ESCO1/2 acetyl-transferase-domain-containing protein [Clohesyomyces aquaticus]